MPDQTITEEPTVEARTFRPSDLRFYADELREVIRQIDKAGDYSDDSVEELMSKAEDLLDYIKETV